MKKATMTRRLVLLLFVALIFATAGAQKKCVDYVDPFIGTGGHGHTYPGATVPFGMVQLSPDNGIQGWDWCSGYHYSDSMIAGFSHTHLSGTGIGDLCDISVMPMANVMPDTMRRRTRFSHDKESAKPGYYQVWLPEYKVNVELTTTARCGLHKYSFAQGTIPTVKVDLGFAINWDEAVECQIQQLSATRFTGYRKSKGWTKTQVIYFAIELNQPVVRMSSFANRQPVNEKSITAKDVVSYLEFAPAGNKPLLMKVALSSAGEEGAVAGLAEISGWNFEETAQNASAAWEKELGKLQASSTDPALLRTFYTALYHTYLAPSLYSDATGGYKGVDGKKQHSTQPVYSVHSLWDTFRGANPLFTLTQPERVGDIIQSYLAFYKQSGLLPVWDLHFFETNTMTGYHAVPVIADAMLKGIRGFDYEEAYAAMKASSMQEVRATAEYRKYGFVPQDKHGWSVTMTLEYAFDDWCIAQVAHLLNKEADYAIYLKRSQSYRQLFDKKTGFFRAKTSDGKWVEPFDPYYSEHGFDGQYIEGTAWQHTFFVPHAVDDYAALLGGKDKLEEKLDSLFTTTSKMNGDNVSDDISGLIGQYAHGNEPSHHIIYMYTALGSNKKAAARIRQVMQTLYSDKPDGLSGNEDCGQMSAWYVWSAMGFYPMNPGSGRYTFGYPLLDKAKISLPGGKNFEVVVKGKRSPNGFIEKAVLNGKSIPVIDIAHAQILEGGILELHLSE
jgi:predicted alpha-1,2-mannosidase